MLKLHSLELIGFKSFADRAKVEFPDHVTAIVGPNGCGKSNLADALSFVLGVATARNLRGQRIEDFIFGGTTERKRSGLTEVRLKLRLSDPSPISFAGVELDGDEVEISRKVYRSGESIYQVNQKRCRLMDLQKFLEQAGLGFSGYAMIAQGKIESFLTAKPLDRRALIEEAAQITGYKAKRRNAEMKLELAQQNLLRVNDITVEVERQLRSLKRQANKTQRYRKLKDEFREVQTLRFSSESKRLGEKLASLGRKLSEFKEIGDQMAAALSSTEDQYNQVNQDREALELEVASRQGRRADIRLELDRTENSIKYHLQQVDQTSEMIKSLESEREVLERAVELLDNEQKQNEASEDQLKIESEEIEKQLKKRREHLESKTHELELAEERLEEYRAKLMRLSAEVAALRNLKEQAVQRSKRAQVEKERLLEERSAAQLRLTEARSRLEERELKRTSLEGEVAGIRLSLEELRSKREQTAEELDRLTAGETELRNRLVALKERLHSLQELEISRSNYSEGVKKVLGHLNKNEAFKAAGTLADSIETSPQFERLVEEFLGDELEYILVDSLDQAIEGLAELRTLKSGKCTFFSLRTSNGFGKHRESFDRSGLPKEPEGVYGTLSDVLKMKPELQAAFTRVLPQRAEAIVVSDIDRAMQLVHSYPEQTFITLQGESLAPRGLVSGSAAGAKRTGLLGLKRQRRELEKKVAEQAKVLSSAETDREKKKDELGLVTGKSEEIQTRLYQREKQLIGLGHECDQAAADVSRQERTVRTHDFEVERLETESDELIQKLETTSESVVSFDSERIRVESALKSGRDGLSGLREDVSSSRDEVNSILAKLQVLEERKLALARTHERIAGQKRESISRLDSIELRKKQGHERKKSLKEELQSLKVQVDELRKESIETDRVLEDSQKKFADCKAVLRNVEAGLAKQRDERSELQEKRSAVDIEYARIETQVQNLEVQCIEQLKSSLVDIVAEIDLETIDLVELEEDYNRLRNRLENFGPINMTALQEYEENQERYEFLSKQKQDIEQSISDTTKAIQDLNRRSRARFTEAFEAVNANFKMVFQRLFSGGDCGIELLDEEDILECGIDVFAQPPGKRLQNVMLLSGGEKALTVFALLMGIFMYRPSRFCVLDEVDAPLDDANVKRFGQLIEEMSKDTQFMIVTHNKRTMEIAKTIYGITMEEAGISKVVSAQF